MKPDEQVALANHLARGLKRQIPPESRISEISMPSPQIDPFNRHRCEANGCDILVQSGLLMRPGHWHLVPMALRDAIWNAYRRKRSDPGRRLTHCLACADAVEHLARLDRRPIANRWCVAADELLRRGRRAS